MRPGRLSREWTRRARASGTSGNHQMHHHEQVVVEAENEALAQAAQGAHDFVLQPGDRRIVGANDERVADTDAFDGGTEHAGPEGMKIELDVGQFGHRSILLTGDARVNAASGA